MDKKLIKEIITTETEKFTDDGTIKERIKEIREKVYADANAFSKKDVEEAEVVESEEKIEEKKEPTKEELIAEAGNKLDNSNVEEQVQPQQNPYMPPNSYNVLNRTTPSPMGPLNNQVKFPWEKQ